PTYDVAALNRGLREEGLALAATLGPTEVTNFVPPAHPFQISDLWNNPLITVPVIVLLILWFGWLLYRAAQNVDVAER
ncbi:MAG: hypothetical protein KDA58_12370, partial [Planctomycetaceae bacterium]|nr:hypothetical protein [Planctomycetaceae bacterium]